MRGYHLREGRQEGQTSMWKVEFTEKAEKQIIELIAEGKISEMDRQLIGDWIRIVKMNGPKVLQAEKHWNDHPLEREWFGHRSSAYSPAGRIIYTVIENKVLVLVVKITPDHNYKKDR